MNSATKVTLLTEWFPPEGRGFPLNIAQGIRDADMAVNVVTGVPHYPTGVPADGYPWRSRRCQTIDGFPVLRVPEFPSHDRSPLRRIVTFGSFALSSAAWGSRTIGQSDVCLVYSSPATAALAAMKAHRRYGVPYVLHIQDLWPDSLLSAGFELSGTLRRLLSGVSGRFVDAAYRGAAHVAVTSPGMRTALIDRGVPNEKVSVVYNWVEEGVLTPRPASGLLRRRLGLADADFVLLFAGNMGEAQGLDAWVEAVNLLQDLSNVHFVLVGDGTRRQGLVEMAERGRRERIHFLHAVPLAEAAVLTADADVCVVSLTDVPLFQMTLPSKLQGLLAQAKPVISSVPGDGARVVETAGAGWTAKPDDAVSIAAVIRQASQQSREDLAERGRSGYAYYLEHMSRTVGSRRLAQILQDVADGRRKKF